MHVDALELGAAVASDGDLVAILRRGCEVSTAGPPTNAKRPRRRTEQDDAPAVLAPTTRGDPTRRRPAGGRAEERADATRLAI